MMKDMYVHKRKSHRKYEVRLNGGCNMYMELCAASLRIGGKSRVVKGGRFREPDVVREGGRRRWRARETLAIS